MYMHTHLDLSTESTARKKRYLFLRYALYYYPRKAYEATSSKVVLCHYTIFDNNKIVIQNIQYIH